MNEQEFNERADRWELESAIHSAPGSKILHSDYQHIIGGGREMVPYILNRIKTSNKDWYWALEHITHANPAKNANSLDEARKIWLDWGIKNGYIKEL